MIDDKKLAKLLNKTEKCAMQINENSILVSNGYAVYKIDESHRSTISKLYEIGAVKGIKDFSQLIVLNRHQMHRSSSLSF